VDQVGKKKLLSRHDFFMRKHADIKVTVTFLLYMTQIRISTASLFYFILSTYIRFQDLGEGYASGHGCNISRLTPCTIEYLIIKM